MNRATRSRLLRAGPSLLGGAGVLYLVLLAVYSRPIADDWAALSNTREAGFASTIDSSGRYSAQALVWVVVHLFGATSTQLTPLIVLAVLWASSTWALSEAARAARLTAPTGELALLALLLMVGCFSVAPSLIDNVAWLSGVAGYTAPLAATACLTAWCWRLVTAPAKRARLGVAVALAGGFVTGGFHELVGLILLPTAGLAWLTARSLRASRALVWAIATGGVGAAAGLAVNLLNPATGRRATDQHARIALVQAGHTAWHDLSFLWAPIDSGLVAFAVAAGIITWQLFAPAITPRIRRWLAAWSAHLILVPWVVVSVACAWANSTESGDRAPFRAAFLFTGSAALGVALLVAGVLSRFPRALSQGRAPLLALVLAGGGLLALDHQAVPLLRAERMRIRALNRRAASVREQLAADSTNIRLLPAPLLTDASQALDLSFAPGAEQRLALVDLLRTYYDIPRADTVRVISRQPGNYCLPGVSPSWVGVQSCQQLAADR